MSYELPRSDEMLPGIQAEYRAARDKGGSALRDSKFRLAWGLVHSSRKGDVETGLALCRELLRESEGRRDAEYYIAVAYFKLGQYVAARRQLSTVLAEWPEFRQAEQLKVLVEDKLVKEGLIGVGVAVGIGAVAASVMAMMSRR